jgi:hypothetical protein
MSETKTIQTVYGETEIDVVECSSCGNEIAKDEAARFAMHTETVNPRFNQAERSGYACEHCFSEGPASFPERSKERIKTLSEDGDVLFGVLLWPFISLLILADTNNEWEVGFGVASLGGWFWVVLTFVVCYGVLHV